MKTILKTGMMISATLFVFAACNESEMNGAYELEGTYLGVFKNSNKIDGPFIVGSANPEATAVITSLDDDKIEVHCYGTDLDTTFMLNYYQHDDSLMVCASGDDFEHLYGHGLGDGHMSGHGGMMGDRDDDETEWMHHMSDEHDDDDAHFGAFNTRNNSFHYIFGLTRGQSVHYVRFEGMKE